MAVRIHDTGIRVNDEAHRVTYSTDGSGEVLGMVIRVADRKVIVQSFDVVKRVKSETLRAAAQRCALAAVRTA